MFNCIVHDYDCSFDIVHISTAGDSSALRPSAPQFSHVLIPFFSDGIIFILFFSFYFRSHFFQPLPGLKYAFLIR